MKRIITLTLMLVVATSVSVAVPHGKKPQGNKSGLEKTVNTFFDAVKARNVQKMKTYYTSDYTFTDPEGQMLSVEDRLKLIAGPNASTFVSASEINIRTYGSAGVVTGIATTSGATERFIQMWTWQGGRWRLAASQVTRIGQ